MIYALKKLNEGVLSPAEYKRLYPRGATIPRLYGIPKTHKDNVPMRPILSMTKTAYEPLSKWLAEKLRPIETHFSQHCVKDSFDFVDVLRGTNTRSPFPAPSSSTVMVSYDVSSLFTNVPVLETIDVIVRVAEAQLHLCDIPSFLLRQLLLLCTTNVLTIFSGDRSTVYVWAAPLVVCSPMSLWDTRKRLSKILLCHIVHFICVT